MYGLLTKCDIKMAGYWPSFFFLCVYGPKSRSIKSQKKMTPISSHLDRTNFVNKGFIIWLLGKFCLRDTAGSPKRARWLHLHLAHLGSQSQWAIWFISSARGASHIKNDINVKLEVSRGMHLHVLYTCRYKFSCNLDHKIGTTQLPRQSRSSNPDAEHFVFAMHQWVNFLQNLKIQMNTHTKTAKLRFPWLKTLGQIFRTLLDSLLLKRLASSHIDYFEWNLSFFLHLSSLKKWSSQG